MFAIFQQLTVIMSYQEGQIAMAKVEDFPYWPCRITQLLPNHAYQVSFIGEKAEATVLESDMKEYNLVNKSVNGLRQNKYFAKLKKAISLTDQFLNKSSSRQKQLNEEDSQSFHQEKREKSKREGSISREQYKKKPKLQVTTLYIRNNKQISQPQSNPCIELSRLLAKLGQFARNSWHNCETKEILKETEVKRLKQLLDVTFQLDIKDILQEWLIEHFILLRNQLKQWKLQKYAELQGMVDLKYQQIANYMLSEEFEKVEINDFRKKSLIAKITKNTLSPFEQNK